MNSILSLLGLCKKAGKVVFGTDAVVDKLSHNKIYLLFLANDASESTIDKIEKKAFFYKVPVNKSFTTVELNDALGLKNVKVIGILDQGFAKSLKEKLSVRVESEIN